MRKIYGDDERVTVVEIDDRKLGLTGTFSLRAWRIWCEELFCNEDASFPPNSDQFTFTWYSGDSGYLGKLQELYPNHYHQYMDRTKIPVSGTQIRQDPYKWKDQIHPVFWDYLQTQFRGDVKKWN